uniref:Caspase family p20 domain-containing protein n=1 Tax=Globodera rostochiensis TaxID=31243 RepID=A0A914HL03_GLORO
MRMVHRPRLLAFSCPTDGCRMQAERPAPQCPVANVPNRHSVCQIANAGPATRQSDSGSKQSYIRTGTDSGRPMERRFCAQLVAYSFEHEGGLPIVVPWFAQKAFCPPPHPTSAASVSIKHTKPFVQQRLQCKTSSKQLQEIIEVYSNSSSPRGLALIIANDKFTNRRLPARPGSDVDVKNIKKLLAGLGYDIFANRNETAECSKNCGRGFRRRKVRCLAARNNSVRLDKGKCTEQNRPRRREPCFVRNCLPSDCAELREQNAHTTGMLDGNYTLCTILARHRGQAQARIFSVDFMVAHSSFPRYISWRCTAHGSWFIQAICKGFSEMAAQTDLLTMMTEVNALVQRLECHEDKGKNRRRKRVSL